MLEEIPIWKNKNIEDLPGELWKPIVDKEDFTGRYYISNMGRVKSVRIRGNDSYSYTHSLDKIMSQGEDKKKGYLGVSLYKNKKEHNRKVHILVATMWVDNPENKPTVNHKKGNKKDNRSAQLEWNTYGENHKHSYSELGRIHSMIGITGYKNKQSKEVICITNGKKYGSVTDAANELGLNFQNVSKVCKGRRPHSKGYVFKFTSECLEQTA